MKKRSPKAQAARRRRARTVGSRALRLPAQCTLATADHLKAALARVLHSVTPVTLDARSVERVDAASMQLLAAFARDRAAHEARVDVRAPSRKFSEAVQLLGLGALLGPVRGAASAPAE